MAGAWFHMRAAKSNGLTISMRAWASMLGASWPPTPLTAWQATQPLTTNTCLPRSGFMMGNTRRATWPGLRGAAPGTWPATADVARAAPVSATATRVIPVLR